MAQQIHIVEDDVAFGKMLTTFLERKGFAVSVSLSGENARKMLTDKTFHFLITDLKLPDDSGLALLEFSQKIAPNTKVILMTGYAEVDTAVKAIKKGALDYISKPFRPEELLMIIEEETSKSKDVDLNFTETKTEPISAPETKFVVGISESSKKFNEYLKLVGPTDMCVLIQGESGTGKEVAAKAIHKYSSR
jgi:two-component system response regulator HydG